MDFSKRFLIFLITLIIISVIFYVLFLIDCSKFFEVKDKAFVEINDYTFFVDIADDPMSRSKGLSGRENIGINEGMLFVFENKDFHSFWMKDMNFPIDIIWISEDEVVGIEEEVENQPGVNDENLSIYRPLLLIDKVLEVKAGVSDIFKISEGDNVDISFIINSNESCLQRFKRNSFSL